MGLVNVPDQRLDQLGVINKSVKVVPAVVSYLTSDLGKIDLSIHACIPPTLRISMNICPCHVSYNSLLNIILATYSMMNYMHISTDGVRGYRWHSERSLGRGGTGEQVLNQHQDD